MEGGASYGDTMVLWAFHERHDHSSWAQNKWTCGMLWASIWKVGMFEAQDIGRLETHGLEKIRATSVK